MNAADGRGPVDRDVGRLREAAAYSHNFATAKPDIGDAEREHLLGLCALLSETADAIEAGRARMCFERAKATVAERDARRLRAENEALRVDAARYRWLREYNTSVHTDVTNAFFLGDENLDAAIDAAIEKETTPNAR